MVTKGSDKKGYRSIQANTTQLIMIQLIMITVSDDVGSDVHRSDDIHSGMLSEDLQGAAGYVGCNDGSFPSDDLQ